MLDFSLLLMSPFERGVRRCDEKQFDVCFCPLPLNGHCHTERTRKQVDDGSCLVKAKFMSVGQLPSMGSIVDVEELLQNPRATLLPLLRRIQGWGQVQSCCCPLCSAKSAAPIDECHSKFVLQADDDQIKVKQLSGAMTNLIYRADFVDGEQVRT